MVLFSFTTRSNIMSTANTPQLADVPVSNCNSELQHLKKCSWVTCQVLIYYFKNPSFQGKSGLASQRNLCRQNIALN